VVAEDTAEGNSRKVDFVKPGFGHAIDSYRQGRSVGRAGQWKSSASTL